MSPKNNLLTYFSHCLLLFVGEKPNALAEPRGEEESLTKKGKKKKTVHWAEDEQLKHYFYFDLDETERGKAFGLEYPTYLKLCVYCLNTPVGL